MMSRALFRTAAALTALFTLGHSFGTYAQPKGAQSGVATVMKSVRFDVFGSQRTYWDMFHGYGVLIIFTGAFLAVLLWLLSQMPAQTSRPIGLLVGALQIGFAVIAFQSFFWAPAAFNAISAICALVAVAKA